LLPFFGSIIFNTSLDASFPPVSLTATKRAAKIVPTSVTGMREKQDVAVSTPGQAVFEMGLFFENKTDGPIISCNNPSNLILAVPIGNKLKVRFKLYYKKAKCSLISLIYLGIPS